MCVTAPDCSVVSKADNSAAGRLKRAVHAVVSICMHEQHMALLFQYNRSWFTAVVCLLLCLQRAETLHQACNKYIHVSYCCLSYQSVRLCACRTHPCAKSLVDLGVSLIHFLAILVPSCSPARALSAIHTPAASPIGSIMSSGTLLNCCHPQQHPQRRPQGELCQSVPPQGHFLEQPAWSPGAFPAQPSMLAELPLQPQLHANVTKVDMRFCTCQWFHC